MQAARVSPFDIFSRYIMAKAHATAAAATEPNNEPNGTTNANRPKELVEIFHYKMSGKDAASTEMEHLANTAAAAVSALMLNNNDDADEIAGKSIKFSKNLQKAGISVHKLAQNPEWEAVVAHILVLQGVINEKTKEIQALTKAANDSTQQTTELQREVDDTARTNALLLEDNKQLNLHIDSLTRKLRRQCRENDELLQDVTHYRKVSMENKQRMKSLEMRMSTSSINSSPNRQLMVAAGGSSGFDAHDGGRGESQSNSSSNTGLVMYDEIGLPRTTTTTVNHQRHGNHHSMHDNHSNSSSTVMNAKTSNWNQHPQQQQQQQHPSPTTTYLMNGNKSNGGNIISSNSNDQLYSKVSHSSNLKRHSKESINGIVSSGSSHNNNNNMNGGGRKVEHQHQPEKTVRVVTPPKQMTMMMSPAATSSSSIEHEKVVNMYTSSSGTNGITNSHPAQSASSVKRNESRRRGFWSRLP